MDIATLIGLGFGIGVLLIAVVTGSSLAIFLNLAGLLIVIGGTLAATLIKFPLSTIVRAMRLGVRTVFVGEADNPRALIDLAERLVEKVRREGVLSLEKEAVPNTFFRRGIQLVVDGHRPELIRRMLTTEMDNSILHHEEGERIFRAIGDSSPAFGMIGTLVGLVQMLSNLSDPNAIGPAMAVALLTTLYGALIAYLIALPMADKIELRRVAETVNKALIIEGVLAIQQGQNPHVMEELLSGYLAGTGKEKPAEAETPPATEATLPAGAPTAGETKR
jgi:chemotaxis protein MotA